MTYSLLLQDLKRPMWKYINFTHCCKVSVNIEECSQTLCGSPSFLIFFFFSSYQLHFLFDDTVVMMCVLLKLRLKKK